MSFTDVFGGDTLYPADLSYRAIALTASTTLQWPTEASAQTNLVAAIMDVTASAGPFVITMPPATEVSTGTAVVFNNVGANTFVVNDNSGTQILSVASGLIWTAYVTSNATAAGTWETYQNGAGTSSATAAALAGYGIKAITTTLNQSMPVTLVSVDFTADATYRAGVWVWTGGAGIASLTSPVTLGNDWFTNIKNSGSGNLVLTPLSGTIDGTTTVTLGPDESAIIVSDGTDFYTIGLTPIPVPGFDYVTIAVPGTGNYTLTGTELGRISYSFTGILTGARTIIVPAAVQQYWVTNNTTGSFTLTVKTSAGTGIVVPQGLSLLLRCDGTNVVDATTGRIVEALPTSAGTNTITATLSPFPTYLTAGVDAAFIAGGTNTGATTFNPNGLGAAAVQKDGLALAANDILIDNTVSLKYNGTAWQMMSPTALSVSANVSALAALTGAADRTPVFTALGAMSLLEISQSIKTYSPTLLGSAGNPTVTYSAQTGYYIRIGPLCIVWGTVATSAYSGGSGNLRIGNLPFSVNATSSSVGMATGWDTFNLSAACVGLSMPASTSYLSVNEVFDNAATTSAQVGQWGAATNLSFLAVYRV